MHLIEAIAPHGSREEWLFFAIGWLLAISLMLVVRLFGPKRVALRSAGILTVAYFAFFLARRLTIGWLAVADVFGTAAVLTYTVTLARLSFQIIFDVVIARSRREPLPRIVRDIAQGVVFMFVGIWSLRAAGVEFGQLLTTSALLTVVAGLALQETLGNLVAGLAIQADRPFDVGDWIEIHGAPGHIGRVREINWRATRIHTLDNVDVVVPNGLIAKASVTNYDRPHGSARRSIFFHAGYGIAPPDVSALVLEAIRDAPGVLADPPPSVVTYAFDKVGVQYWLRYFLSDMSRRDGIDGGVRDRIWYAFSRRGMAFPFPTHNVDLRELTESSRALAEERSLRERIDALGKIEILAPLSQADLRVLAQRATRAPFSKGETVIRQGEQGDTMFVVADGELSVRIESGGDEREAARLGPGSFFGEMSLLTGDPRRATVVALDPCELYVIDHAAFQALLANHPGIAELISSKVIERQLKLDLSEPHEPEVQKAVEAQSHALVDRIWRFFRA